MYGNSLTVFVSQNAQEYAVVTLTETAGIDISNTVVQLSLGTINAPGRTWYPTQSVDSAMASVRKVELMLDSSFALGTYALWAKIVDEDETIITRCGTATVVLV